MSVCINSVLCSLAFPKSVLSQANPVKKSHHSTKMLNQKLMLQLLFSTFDWFELFEKNDSFLVK